MLDPQPTLATGARDHASGKTTSPRETRWRFEPVRAHERPRAEAFIKTGFHRAYGARLSRFMPALMALRRDGEMVAACGLRPSAGEALFLETYLDAPVETALARRTGAEWARADIVEVGNLVVARAGFARDLITHLTTHLHSNGPAWTVFTAVPALRNNFLRLGIPLVTLAPADGARLPPAARTEWGSYYDQSPVVTAVNVRAAFHALREGPCTR